MHRGHHKNTRKMTKERGRTKDALQTPFQEIVYFSYIVWLSERKCWHVTRKRGHKFFHLFSAICSQIRISTLGHQRFSLPGIQDKHWLIHHSLYISKGAYTASTKWTSPLPCMLCKSFFRSCHGDSWKQNLQQQQECWESCLDRYKRQHHQLHCLQNLPSPVPHPVRLPAEGCSSRH